MNWLSSTTSTPSDAINASISLLLNPDGMTRPPRRQSADGQPHHTMIAFRGGKGCAGEPAIGLRATPRLSLQPDRVKKLSFENRAI
jgi:hypothetical protein